MEKSKLEKVWYNVKEAAEYLSLAPKTVYNNHCKGLLKGYNAGGTAKGRLLFKKEHLDEYVERSAS